MTEINYVYETSFSVKYLIREEKAKTMVTVFTKHLGKKYSICLEARTMRELLARMKLGEIQYTNSNLKCDISRCIFDVNIVEVTVGSYNPNSPRNMIGVKGPVFLSKEEVKVLEMICDKPEEIAFYTNTPGPGPSDMSPPSMSADEALNIINFESENEAFQRGKQKG